MSKDKSARVTVPLWALVEVLSAIKGPNYMIRELQAIRALRGHDCPINALDKALEQARNFSHVDDN